MHVSNSTVVVTSQPVHRHTVVQSGKKAPDNLCLAIVSIFFCFCCGILALMESNKVELVESLLILELKERLNTILFKVKSSNQRVHECAVMQLYGETDQVSLNIQLNTILYLFRKINCKKMSDNLLTYFTLQCRPGSRFD